jgi:hypothetical protein
MMALKAFRVLLEILEAQALLVQLALKVMMVHKVCKV